MITQPLGTDEKRIVVTLAGNTVDELERRAASMRLAADDFALFILISCIQNDRMLVGQD